MPRARLQGRRPENQHPVGQIAMHEGVEGAVAILWTLSAAAAGIRCYARLATGQPSRRDIDCAETLSTVIKELWDASSVSYHDTFQPSISC